MKRFKDLDKRPVNEVEKDISKKWQSINRMYDLQIEKNKDNEKYVFYDGPAFANGFPGLHHMVSKNLKDTITKYHSMNGKKVIRKIGWDTHGLPIENHVEKKLGISSKKEIEEMGIAKFNEECRKSVRENEDAFTNLTSQMGQFFDVENPYLTYTNDYIETEWWILKKMFEENMFYEGTRVVPYCPHCGTGLATHEVAQGYKTVTTNTVYVTFKKKDEDVYFLVWTTTPWTLTANVALCVNPDEEYSLVESKGNKFILASSLVSSLLGDDVTILEKYKGKDLEYQEFEQLIPSSKVDKKAFFVTCDSFVTTSDGTGVVHMAPAFGEDDANIGKKYDLPYLNTVGKDGCYIDGFWEGRYVHEVNEDVIAWLKDNNKLFKKQKVTHEYPHCWRCDTPLLYYSMPSYYIKVSEMTDKLVEANSKVNWYPSYVGEKRFANWLANARDWNVSRSRYWGSPIPFWKCECGHTHMVGSIEELKELATTKVADDLDLHKPYIDEIYLKCQKCGKDMERIPDVLDCWFDSGAMPFAQYHYPFENQELFEEQFPADFICEGIDQTRGWFYTLMVISTFVKGCSPFKNVLVNDLLLDSEGKKMSKSRGNVVEPFATIKEYGADTIRFYLPYVSPVWTPLKFDYEGLKEVFSKFFNPLKNTYSFFAMYANIDKIDIDNIKLDYKDREEIDKWLLSKYNKLVKNVRDSFEEYDLHKVVHFLSTFVSDDLSNWYIRRNRSRFWGNELNNSKKAVYLTTYEVLIGLSKLIAPITPFISEELYLSLTNEKNSVHLEDYPVYNNKRVNEDIETKMDLVRDLISLGRNAREVTKIKVRQPISKVVLDFKNKSVLGNLKELIIEELNVKEVEFTKDLSQYMTFTVKPNFKVCGPMFGPKIKILGEALRNLKEEDIFKLQDKQSIKVLLDNEEFEITPDLIEITIDSKEGFNTSSDGKNFIILDTNLTEDLLDEGIARELVSKVQQLRKNKDFEISDRIKIFYSENSDFKKAIVNYIEFIKNETLAVSLEEKTKLNESFDLNGLEVYIDVEKVN